MNKIYTRRLCICHDPYEGENVDLKLYFKNSPPGKNQIGFVSEHGIELRRDGSSARAIGWIIFRPKYRNKGYMQEALKACLPNDRDLWVWISKKNPCSQKVATNLGFVFEYEECDIRFYKRSRSSTG